MITDTEYPEGTRVRIVDTLKFNYGYTGTIVGYHSGVYIVQMEHDGENYNYKFESFRVIPADSYKAAESKIRAELEELTKVKSDADKRISELNTALEVFQSLK